jgi:bis(5'-nucleosidyl)-tetraphosphatase
LIPVPKNWVITVLNEKSCGAVVFARTPEIMFLLLHYDAGHWDFVKGNVESNESEKDTAFRELKEETGIVDAKFIEGFRQKIDYFYKRQGTAVYKEVVFFLMETQTVEVVLSFEHIGCDWLDYQHALDRLTFRNAKYVLQKAYALLKTEGIAK